MNELESKVREIEGKRGALLLEYERDKAKWSLEKDHLNTKAIELQENIDRYEKKLDKLVRENEKFKTDKNTIKRQNSGSRLISNNNSSNMNNYNMPGTGNNSIHNTPNRKEKEISMYTNSKRESMAHYSYVNNISNTKESDKTTIDDDSNSIESFRTDNSSFKEVPTLNNMLGHSSSTSCVTGLNNPANHKFSIKSCPKIGDYSNAIDPNCKPGTTTTTSSSSAFNKKFTPIKQNPQNNNIVDSGTK